MRHISGVLFYKLVQHRLEGKFYGVIIRPTMLYGAECWSVKTSHIHKMKVAKTRMVH